jgi:hypothetical protein
MSGSHTPAAARHHHDADRRLRLVSTAERGLPEQLAGAIDGHLATFAEHVREGLLAASTAVGLQVMSEMMQAEVTELAGPKGRFAVGTALAGGPPHRSQRALLTHWAPALDTGVESFVGPGVQDAGGRKPFGCQAAHAGPGHPCALAAAP